jgi:hypothetical protein
MAAEMSTPSTRHPPGRLDRRGGVAAPHIEHPVSGPKLSGVEHGVTERSDHVVEPVTMLLVLLLALVRPVAELFFVDLVGGCRVFA